jgi:3-oxoacyl-[acyl-carrier-protein] synthase I
LVYSLLMMKNGFIAPNINFENPDEYSEKINIFAQTEQRTLRTVLSNSFGFGGTNSSVILKAYD